MHPFPDKQFSVVDQLVVEIDLLFKIAAGVGSAFNLGARLWLSAADMRREIKAIHRDIARLARAAGSLEIDPDDRMTDRMLAMQGTTRSLIERLRAMIGATPRWMPAAWLLRLAEKDMLDQHRLLGLSRVLVLEHDADCSPVLEETFDSVDALVDALHRDAA